MRQNGPVPYFEAQDRLPVTVDGYPSFFFQSFGEVDTHARMLVPVSVDVPAWPVVLFLPGWGSPREDYTALCTDLASRGYVVMALSHPYESAVSVLADGRVVGQASGAGILGGNMTDLAEIRTGDSRFALDQLSRLATVEPQSPLVGYLDLQHAGIIGHSLGGAAASEVIATDPRFLVGVNLDGTLSDALASARLERPFLWLQSDGTQQTHYQQVRDQFLGGLRGGGELLIVGGSSHTSFTDLSTYLSPAGHRLLDGGAGPSTPDVITSLTGDLIAGFVGPSLGGPAASSLDQALARHPSVRRERRIAPAVTS